MDVHWSLSNKSPQVFRTLLSILADLSNAEFWTVYSRVVIFKSSSPCTNHLMTELRAPITIGIIVTFMFHSFCQFPSKVQVLIPLFGFFQFILWFIGTPLFAILQVLFSLLIIVRSDRLADIK